MGSFSEDLFERKLLQLRETHESISNLSSWCLANQAHHYKIVSTWLSVLKKVKIEHRLILFYLANDVIQYSRRKHLPFVETFAPALQKATTLVREDSVKNKILRLFKIWDDRGVYDESFLLDLSGLLVCDPKSGSRIDVQEFQPHVLYSRIRSCKKLEDDTDLKLKLLNESKIPLTDIDKMRKTLKDREHVEDVMEEFTSALKKMKDYVKALETEIKERSGLIDLLETGEQYYEKDCREAKIVVNAYRCFGVRVKQVQKKLDEKISELPSPVPSPPDINAPSPPPSPGVGERDISDMSGNDFVLGDSFINNSSMISDRSIDSEVPSHSFYKNSQSLINNYYIPPVYNPSMTTGNKNQVVEPARESYSPYSEDDLNNSTNSSQNYSAEFFTGSAISDNSSYSSKANNSSYHVNEFMQSSETGKGLDSRLESYANTSMNPVNPNIDSDVFSSFMQQISKSQISDNALFSVPPPPPPPPPPEPEPVKLENENFKSPPTSPDPPSEGNKIEVIGSTPIKKLSITEILQSLMPKTELPIPLKPPPMPPSGLQMSDSEASFSWVENMDNWSSPQSPSDYEDNYLSTGECDKIKGEDIDMRKKDVDHRNLISLTGSDGWSNDRDLEPPKETKPIVTNYSSSPTQDYTLPPPPTYKRTPSADYKATLLQQFKNEPITDYKPTVPGDSKPLNLPSYKPTPIRDYRPAPLPEVKHTPIPEYTPTPVDKISPEKSLMNIDNVENVDMEMSDEDEKKENDLSGIEIMPSGDKVANSSVHLPMNDPYGSPSMNNFGRAGILGNVMIPPPPPPPIPREAPSWLPPPPTYSPHPQPPMPQFPNRHFSPRRPQHFHNANHRPFRPPMRHFNRTPRFQHW